MHTTTLLPILLSLPFLSTAVPQNLNPNANPAPTPAQAQPQPASTVNPEQFDARYASLASGVSTDPGYLALASNLAAANIPTPLAGAQESSYI
ncbi:MAG: hypothetical protein Q9169_008670, partial [Polycauliona sp. 2 TL-2023]